MDKKKVKELTDKALKIVISTGGFSEQDDGNLEEMERCLEDIKAELSKSDWISVEDRLPEFGEYVYTRITNIDGAAIYPVTKREKDGESILVRDYHKFVVSNMGCSVTHWKPIEKLEE